MPTPIHQSTFQYSYEEFLKYQELSGERSLSRNTVIFNAALAAVGLVFALLLNMIGAGISFIFLAAFDIAAAYLIIKIAEKRKFKRNKNMWTSLAEINLYEDKVTLAADTWKHQNYDYDDFYKILDGEDRIYLIAGPRDILILDKDKCNTALLRAITSLPGYKEASS